MKSKYYIDRTISLLRCRTYVLFGDSGGERLVDPAALRSVAITALEVFALAFHKLGFRIAEKVSYEELCPFEEFVHIEVVALGRPLSIVVRETPTNLPFDEQPELNRCCSHPTSQLLYSI